MKLDRLPMDISIVIVSYNSSNLLMLTIASVRRAIEGLKAEVFVVDNDSKDGAPERVERETPWVKLIKMGANRGFSAANNEAMKICTGRIVLILNPDTILCRDTLRKMIAHFKENPGCGALGVRMVNGEGRFLGESKRGYTTPLTSLLKLSGLWRIAPKHPVINAYYIGDCAETSCCHAPILSGACMAFSHDMMDLAGLFDDTYFMYSEDNDLSWRMDQTSSDGNSYRGDISIVHFKGQSTPRNKKYIDYFYDSMLLFASKYEFPKHSTVLNHIILMGIRVAYYVARIRCAVMKKIEGGREFIPPKQILVISDRALRLVSNSEQICYKDLWEMDSTQFDAIIFDLDGDMDDAIEYMRYNERRTMFGFHNPDNAETLVFYNNACHIIR